MTRPAVLDSRAIPPWPLFAILALAVVVRVVFWLQAQTLPFFMQPTGDSATHLNMAREILDTGLLAPLGRPYQQAPLYPFFLALVEWSGWGVNVVRMIQFLIGTLTVPLLWTLGHRIAGRTGAVIASLMMVSGPIVFFEGELLSISLTLSCLALGLVALGTRARGLPAGLCFGLAAIAQPNLLIVGVGIGGLLLIRELQEPTTARKAWLFALGLALLPGFTCARNLVQSGEPVLISSNGGINFFIGNNADATGTFHFPAGSGLINRGEGLFDSARDRAEQLAGRPLTELAVDRYWWGQGLAFWFEAPAEALSLTLYKVVLTLNDYEIPNHHDYETFRSRVSILRVLPTLGWVLPLGILGLALNARRGGFITTGYVTLAVASVAIFFVTARYRLPLYLAIWPAAGLAVAELPALVRNRAQLAGAVLVLSAGTLLAFWPLHDRGDATAYMANLEGRILFERGDPEGARGAFERALALEPEQPEALHNLGRLAVDRGDRAIAHGYFRRAISSDPLQAASYFALEALYRDTGASRPALEVLDRLEIAREGRVGDIASRLAYRRAFHLFTLGEPERAIALLETSSTRDPRHAATWQTLSSLYRAAGRLEEAQRAEERAAALTP